ncbi:hypothetical protein HJC23_008183 [Cyclotella cryptica]|uniref:Ubiquinone biosynthesis O-methyltransferase, mitochondrial n=1 Tax=Cyclotella cryptica TaxID=29204 RepID=A0ABD3P6C9_9STRA|eukprot:CCRYP_017587-RA/>CCRYP_017587-RA protein AED:0.27 eAED:0.27 QI:0/-1/0/1/-1/1/1/0/357
MVSATLLSTAGAILNGRHRAPPFLLRKELVFGCFTTFSKLMYLREASSSNNIVDKSASINEVEPPNASQIEVNKFSSFASQWWDSRSNPLVSMNPVRIKFLRDAVHQFQVQRLSASLTEDYKQTTHRLPLYNKQILDIGCGGGLLTESLSRLGASLVVGVDASPKVVDAAKLHSFHESSRLFTFVHNERQNDNELGYNGIPRVHYFGGLTVEELAAKWHSKPNVNGSSEHLFDIITALEVVEHVPNPRSLLQAATSLLKPNGILFVSTINRTIKSYAIAILAAEYFTSKVPVGTHNWEQFLSPKEVETLVCGGDDSMKQVLLSGMVLRPPFIDMQWSLNYTDTDVNWIGAYQKHSMN